MKKTLATLLFLVFLLPSGLVLAQNTNLDTGGVNSGFDTGGVNSGFDTGGVNQGTNNSVGLQNPLRSGGSIPELFQVLLDIVMVFAVPLIVFFIIYAGFMYVTARGSSDKVQKAHMALLYALIGGVLILGARVLIDVVGGTVDSIIK